MTRMGLYSALIVSAFSTPLWAQVDQTTTDAHGNVVSLFQQTAHWSESWDSHQPVPLASPRLSSWTIDERILSDRLYDNSQPPADIQLIVRGQDSGSSESGGSGGGSDLAGQATNPTSNLSQLQFQNTFIPSTYEADGYANTFAIQLVKPFETGNKFFPTWITRTTIPVVTTADPRGTVPVGPPNGGDFSAPLNSQSGLSDLTVISILNHPTCWGSWGIGPGFVAPMATRRELGEQSWKFSPTFAVIHTAIPTWQIGMLGVYNFPLDGRGTESLLFQPLIVKQLGQGWYTGWGDDLWQFNTHTGNFDMPLQWRVGKVHKFCRNSWNIFVTGAYTPDGLHKGPAPEWGIKFSVSLLIPG